MKTAKDIKSLETVEIVETAEAIEKLENSENLEIGEKEETVEVTEKVETSEKRETLTFTTDFNLTLHTLHSHAMVTGEWAPGKMGLTQFTQCIQQLWQAFEKEDPYAEWQLLKIYDAEQSLKAIMQKQEVLLRTQIKNVRGIQAKPFRNAKPFNVSLRSVNILVLMAGTLIAQTDYMSRQILILKQMGIAPQGQTRPQLFCEEIQKVFMLSQGWKHTGITRKDILDNNDKAKKVEEKFGQLPENILTQKISLPFLFMEE